MKLVKFALKTAAALTALVALALLLLVGYLWLKSPGEAQPITDVDGVVVPGSISAIETVMLGGIEQRMIVRGRNADAPVMLFLHGGPGSPEYPFFRKTNLGLEDSFVMVYWDQRGSGMSYSSDIPEDSMTVDQFIADTAELSRLLAERFGKEKIYLMGHSWGTMLGILTAQRYPELYHAYFGTGQVGYQYEGERLSLDWTRQQATEAQDDDAIAALADITLPAQDAPIEDWLGYMTHQRVWLDRFGGGIMHGLPNGTKKVLGWVMDTPEYTLMDKLNYMRGTRFSATLLWDEVARTNLIEDLGPLEIPVIILEGAYDYQTPYPLANALFDTIEAPEKHFYSFENSAHSPLFEEPERFNALVLEHTGLGPANSD